MYTKPVTPVTKSLFNAQRSIQNLSKYVTKNIAKLKISKVSKSPTNGNNLQL